MTLLDAMRDRALFGPWFATESWRTWRAFLAGLFALPLDAPALSLYRRHTQRTAPPTAPAREAWVAVGRRGGKSRIAALVGVYLGCFRDYSSMLAPGEVGTVAIIAADRRQARTILRYIVGFLDAVPMLARLVEARTTESVTLSNRIVIEVHTASWRTGGRGYTLVAAIADEIAFWRTDDSANPDREILAGLRPSMATIPDALLLCISSPYAHRGALYDAHRKHFGQDGDPVLVWQADSRSMNPLLSEQTIADAYADDPAAARSEYGAEFRSDLESFIDSETLARAIVAGRGQCPPVPGTRYVVAFDAALGGTGNGDSFTGCVAHRAGERLIIDHIVEVRPKFNPNDVIDHLVAELVRPYSVSVVYTDRFAKDFVTDRLRHHGVSHELTDFNRSEAYLAALPWFTAEKVELPDPERSAVAQRCVAQFVNLQRRTGSSGKDALDHPRGAHDDLANVVALAIAHLAHADAAPLVDFRIVNARLARREPSPWTM